MLPECHLGVLGSLNGFSVNQGASRMFGVGRDDHLDLVGWNRDETWRFAWGDKLDPYLCFGTSVWGDQYAYRYGEDGGLEPTVYFLEATLMHAETIAESFEEFAENELLRIARQPYDPITVEALSKFGPVDSAELLAFAPSLALGGLELVENVVGLPAEELMIAAGDIATALRRSRPGTWPTAISPWVDSHGRNRIRVEFLS
jgi:hypothetical protein